MLAGIWIVFSKELAYTLRDRKTLAAMLLLPTLALPLLTYGFSRLTVRTFKQRAVKTVKIAASPATQDAYRRLVHDWFLGTDIAPGVRLVTSPVMQALIKPEELSQLGDLRPEVLTDPVAFAAWTRRIVGLVREGIQMPAPRQQRPLVELPRAVQEQVLAYYEVVIKGLGLVEFVDPSGLPAAHENFAVPVLPPAFRSLPRAPAAVCAIKSGSIHGYLEIPAGAETLDQDDQRALEITFWHDSTNDLSKEANARVTAVISATGSRLVAKRLEARQLTERFVHPLTMKTDTDLATRPQQVLAMLGRVLPMFVLVFTLIGGMYPAIDLGAGEKERYTLETLLLSPLSRTQIALGKALVILGASLTAAFLALTSLALSIRYLLPDELQQRLDIHIDAGTALAVALLTIPPAVSFAGVLLAISIFARSFKEAQNYMTVFMYLIIFLPMAPMLPGLEINWKLALVPLVNVSLLSRDFLAGNPHWGYYALILASGLTVAGLCVAYAVRQFGKEEVLFRS